jgi:RHS repeat-associated protein
MLHKALKAVVVTIALAAGMQGFAATDWSAQDHDLYPGDFNGDGKTDVLYIAKDAAGSSGIALSAAGAPATLWQSWSSNYLGIQWYGGQYGVVVGDFNGDHRSDLLLQRFAPGDNYLLLADSSGRFIGISQTIGNNHQGLAWSKDQHTILAGDFNGDGRDDLFFQSATTVGNNAVLLADSNGAFTSAATQNFTDGSWAAFKWSRRNSVISVGDFNGDGRSDLLVQGLPNIVTIDFDISIPIPVYAPNSFGIVYSQGGFTPFQQVGVRYWNRTSNGVDWSPTRVVAVVGDFNGDGRDDVLLQARRSGDITYLLTSNASGAAFGAGVQVSSNVGISADGARLIAGNFDGAAGAGIYVQSLTQLGTNYIGNTVSVSSTATVHDPATVSEPLPANAIGRTTGQISISGAGAATYSIPITVPKGVMGIQPNLSIGYSSGSGSSLLGHGWSLSGLSEISRCQKTIVQDGATDSVRLINGTSGDRYCLDGNKLRLTGGTYGAAGSTYQTEVEMFSRVTANGTAGAGPASFRVESRDGLFYEYGNSADSRIEVAGTSTPRVWALNKVSDRYGNYMTVSYWEDVAEGTGSFRPKEILYTANDGVGLVSAYRVAFVWEPRPASDVMTSYVAGGWIKEANRLRRVDTYYSGSLVRQYLLNYEVSPATHRSRITSVQECEGRNSTCLAPTIMGWQDGQAGMNAEQLSINLGQIISGTGATAQYTGFAARFVQAIDMNGDGRTDLVYPVNTTWSYRLANAQGIYDSPVDTGIAHADKYGMSVQIDYNSDGLMDLMVPAANNQWQILRSTGSTFSVIATSITAPPSANLTWVTDFDGDARSDLVSVYPPAGTANGRTLTLIRNTGNGFSNIGSSTVLTGNAFFPALAVFSHFDSPIAKSTIQSADFNGDGKADLIAQIADLTGNTSSGFSAVRRISLIYSTGSSYVLDPTPIAQLSAPVAGTIDVIFEGLRVVDLNADGFADLIYECPSDRTNRCVRYGNGLQLGPEINTGRSVGFDQPNAVSIDWDNDGRTDLLQKGVNGNYEVLYATGDTALPLTASEDTGIAPMPIVRLHDLNGDGLTDFGFADSAGVWHVRLHAGSYPDLLRSITDGFGNSLSTTYAPLTDATTYSKGTGAVFPAMDLQLPFYVVKQVTGSDGAGSTFTMSHSYSAARLHLQGRGILGFGNRAEVDSRTGIRTAWTFGLEFPYLRLPAEVRQTQPGPSPGVTGATISHVSYTYDKLTLDSTANNQRYYPYTKTEDRFTYEVGGLVNGALVTEVFTVNTVDDFGNVTVADSRAGTGPYFTTRTDKTITNDTANWCLGFVTQQLTTNTVPGQFSKTRTAQFVKDPANPALCRVLQRIIEPNDAEVKTVTTTGYDTFGHVSSETVSAAGIADRVTSMGYGAAGVFPLFMTNAAGESSSQVFDYALGVPTSSTDGSNLTMSWQYDGFGRKRRQTNSDGTATTWTISTCNAANSYCGDSLLRYQIVERQLNAIGGVIRTNTMMYDSMNRALYAHSQTLSGATSVVKTIYNGRGLATHRSFPYFQGSTPSYAVTGYDLIGRPITEQRPIGDGNSGTQTATFNYEGLKQTFTDANSIGRTTTKYLNSIGQTVQVQDPAGGNTYYTYDQFGNLLTSTDSLGNVVTNTFNIRGYKSSTSDPDMGNWVYTYYPTGELRTQRDAKSQVTEYTYDGLSRQLTRTEPEGLTTWTYGTSIAAKNVGKLVSVTSPGGYSLANTYDSLGRPQDVTTVIDGTSFVVSNGYHPITGFLDSVTYPSSTAAVPNSRFKVQYDYAYGMASAVKDFNNPNTVYWQQAATNAAGQAVEEVFGNGLHSYSTYDSVTHWLSTRNTGTTGQVQNLRYGWDNVGNLKQRNDLRSGLVEDFYYDERYRLEHSTLTAGGTTVNNLTMTYDAAGNVKSKSGIGSYDYMASGPNSIRPHAVTSAGGNAFGYDANGNMNIRNGDAISWYSYNLPNRIDRGSNYSQFFYGAGRDRYKQVAFTTAGGMLQAGTETTVYIGNLFEKVTKPSGVIEYKHYIAAGKAIVALRTIRDNGANDVRYFHMDHLGSVDAITNESGGVVLRLSFDAFGKRRAPVTWSGGLVQGDWLTVAAISHRAYTYHEQLDNVELIHMNGRVYDPNIGRFISADPNIQSPFNSQSFNRYSYVMNNPLSMTDPTGFYSLYEFLDNDNWYAQAVMAYVRVFVPIIVSVVVGYATGGWAAGAAGGGFWGAVVGGAVGAAASEAVNIAFYGGNGKDVLRAAIIGGITAGLAHEISVGVEDWASDRGELVEVTRDQTSSNGKFRLRPLNSLNDASTNKLFTNGIKNTLLEAAQKALEQTKSSVAILFYNPTSGWIADLTESALMKLTGTSSLGNQLAALLQNSRGITTIVAHSQGSLIVSNALNVIGKSGFRFEQTITIIYNGPAANGQIAKKLAFNVGANLQTPINSHFFDIVGNVIGGNTANPFKIIGSILAVPTLFMGPNISPHSVY